MLTDELLLSLLLCNLLTHNFSSCSGLTGLTQVIIAYLQPVIIKTDISWSGFPVGVCVCWEGEGVGVARIKKNCTMITAQFVPS